MHMPSINPIKIAKSARLIELTVLAVSIFIALAFTEQFVASNAFFAGLVNAVGRVVPAVHGMSAVSPNPGMTGTLIAINWLVMPLYFVASIMETSFWNERIADKMAMYFKKSGLVKSYLFVPAFFMWWILSDLNIVPGPGIFSMSDYASFIDFGLNKLVHQHPMTIAIFYFGLVFGEALVYSYLATLALGTIIYFLRKFDFINRSHPA
jgi:hypothetical protein